MDTLKRHHLVQSRIAAQQGVEIPEYDECAHMGWDHETFFTRIPPLLRTAADAPKDPMSDCLAQIPKLVYTYYVTDNHGESVLHEDLLKLFRSTAVVC